MTDSELQEYEKSWAEEFNTFTGNTYGMFTREGAEAIHALVDNANKTKGYTLKRMLKDLELLSCRDRSKYGEATDTAVREAVGLALGFYK